MTIRSVVALLPTMLLMICSWMSPAQSQPHVSLTACQQPSPEEAKRLTMLLIQSMGLRSTSVSDVQKLLDQGADINGQNEAGITALMIASVGGNTKIVSFLIDHKADANKRDQHDFSALLYATRTDHPEVIPLLKLAMTQFSLRDAVVLGDIPLIKQKWPVGYKVDSLDESDSTLLMWAVMAGQKESVNYLLTQGAGIDVAGYQKMKAIHFAAMYNSPEIIGILLDHGARIEDEVTGALIKKTPLELAASEGKLENVKYLLSRGANIHHADKTGVSILLSAMEYGHPDMVEYLLEKGADPNVISEGKPFLFWAIGQGRPNIVKMLVNKGVKVNARDAMGQTALMEVVEANLLNKEQQLALATLLVEHGADPSLKNKAGKTALDLARQNGADKRLIAILKQKR